MLGEILLLKYVSSSCQFHLHFYLDSFGIIFSCSIHVYWYALMHCQHFRLIEGQFLLIEVDHWLIDSKCRFTLINLDHMINENNRVKISQFPFYVFEAFFSNYHSLFGRYFFPKLTWLRIWMYLHYLIFFQAIERCAVYGIFLPGL